MPNSSTEDSLQTLRDKHQIVQSQLRQAVLAASEEHGLGGVRLVSPEEMPSLTDKAQRFKARGAGRRAETTSGSSAPVVTPPGCWARFCQFLGAGRRSAPSGDMNTALLSVEPTRSR
jgi:hypothetical protein